jgi:hypothetical protein
MVEAMTRRRLANFTRTALGLITKVLQLPYQPQWYEIRSSDSITAGRRHSPGQGGRPSEDGLWRGLVC